MGKKIIIFIIIILIVIVGGIFWWQTKKDETSNWQTYRNDEYGFEVKYPSKRYLKEYPNCFLPKEDNCLEEIMIQNMENIFGVSYYVNDTSVFAIKILTDYSSSIEEYIEKWVGEHTENIEERDRKLNEIMINEIKTIEIGGEQHKVWWRKDLDQESIYFLRNGKRYWIYYFSIPLDLFNQDKHIFYQILSTFKFINIAADWQAYRNEGYGFEVKYPQSWKIEDGPLDNKSGEVNGWPLWDRLLINKQFISQESEMYTGTVPHQQLRVEANLIVIENNTNLALDKFIEKAGGPDSEGKYWFEDYQKESTIVGSIEGLKYSSEDRVPSQIIAFQRNQTVIILSPNPYYYASLPQQFNQILSTFKFIK